MATSAALTAYAGTAALLAGALALVQSRQTLWAYQPGDGSAADGWHIAAAGGGNWVYAGAADGATKVNQATWFIDPANSSAAASDDNTGLTSGVPLLTAAEVVRRWGANPTATSGGNITITYLSSDTTPIDVASFTIVSQGPTGSPTQLIITSQLPASSFTGTLLAVTAKNTAAGGTRSRAPLRPRRAPSQPTCCL